MGSIIPSCFAADAFTVAFSPSNVNSILVLLIGVGGGFLFVVTGIYVYFFYLKHIKKIRKPNEAHQSRPVQPTKLSSPLPDPLPTQDHIDIDIEKDPVKETDQDILSIDFPLVQKRSFQNPDAEFSDSSSTRRNTIAQSTASTMSRGEVIRRDTLPPNIAKPQYTTPQQSYQLQVTKPAVVRSFEYLNKTPEPEVTRLSYDNLHIKRPGTGRKLPSTDFAGSQQLQA
ncbi:unnamed protein product [Bursaphelenchus okinawaensis]|uniref:Uncharacterized protein n=1 Tax=Bursaphelenchus okinawaensis TaxID=465554 RepID=A0A811K8L8_9BILA|nr:unnamed protein product [Bursaphelenchus okinawaensis]CAG9095063.1 unnamed protein product [Bursaphelenchus okinawaensis]